MKPPPAPIARHAVGAVLLVAACAVTAWTASARIAWAEPRAAAGASVPDLPFSDVVRLTEEARGLPVETKSGPRLSTSGGHSALADSVHAWDARHYRLDLTASRTINTIAGRMTLDLLIVNPAATQIDLHDSNLNVTATRVNGVARTFTTGGGMLFIPICEGASCPPHGAGDSLQVEVDYSATPPAGYYTYPRNSYTFVEPYDARYWWPCWDLPFDKATVDLFVTVPDTNVCVANGVLVSSTPGAPGTRVYHWRETHPVATYLVAISVASFWQWTQMSGSIPILNAVFPEDSTKAKFDFANVPAMIPIFAARWGPYPFDKYGQVAVTPFGAGGMEHQSLTTINRSWVRGDRTAESGLAHELAHQWWGDFVTCVDFRNIWLNEGFASYGEAQWQQDFYGAAAYDATIQTQMNSALTTDNTNRYALYDPAPANLFGNTIYKKGSLVLHMLRRILGDASFFAGMQLYGQRYAYGTASTADFQKAMEDASGQSLGWYFGPWVYDKGLPTYNWGWQTGPAGPGQYNIGVAVRQVQTNAPLFRMPIEFKVTRQARPDTFVTVMNEAVASQNFVFAVNGIPTGVTLDPRNSIFKRTNPITVDTPWSTIGSGISIALSAAPNPAQSTTLVRVRLGSVPIHPIQAHVFDASGRAIRSLGSSVLGATESDFSWDLRDGTGRRVAPGLYFLQARVGPQHEERSLIVTR